MYFEKMLISPQKSQPHCKCIVWVLGTSTNDKRAKHLLSWPVTVIRTVVLRRCKLTRFQSTQEKTRMLSLELYHLEQKKKQANEKEFQILSDAAYLRRKK